LPMPNSWANAVTPAFDCSTPRSDTPELPCRETGRLSRSVNSPWTAA
jgi:hypothetical protein